MRIQILVDDLDSWYIPYANKLFTYLKQSFARVELIHHQDKIEKGEILFLLSCKQYLSKLKRNLNQKNIVVHASNLPSGRGMSPTTWQILEGKNTIPVTLLEAADSVDSGPIYITRNFHLEGHELIAEIRNKLGNVINELCIEYAKNYKEIPGLEQKGEPTYYRARNIDDSKLDINQNLINQFNLLRISDNEKYPAHFEHLGAKYIIKIYKEEINVTGKT